MELDSRAWSFFMFLTISALFVASISTPYRIKGFAVSFGADGLWDVDAFADGDTTAHYTPTRVFLCLAAAAVAMALLGYVLLFRSVTWASQLIASLSQIVAGLLGVIAVGVFARSETVQGEGWWMATIASAMYLLNGMGVLVMPCMDSDQHKIPSRVTFVS